MGNQVLNLLRILTYLCHSSNLWNLDCKVLWHDMVDLVSFLNQSNFTFLKLHQMNWGSPEMHLPEKNNRKLLLLRLFSRICRWFFCRWNHCCCSRLAWKFNYIRQESWCSVGRRYYCHIGSLCHSKGKSALDCRSLVHRLAPRPPGPLVPWFIRWYH